MIGEGNVIQCFEIIIDIESAPASVRALHADDPFTGAGNRLAIAFRIFTIEQHPDNGRIVHIGIVVIFVLEGPATGAHVGTIDSPVALDVQNLTLAKPFHAALHTLTRLLWTRCLRT